jgi:hypothetical protein
MEYKIVRDTSIKELEMMVTKLMQEGWSPQGGMAISSPNAGMPTLYQAMVHTVKESNKG